MTIETLTTILGAKVQDRATGVTGVVTSVSFDLSGCVQVLVSPPVRDGGMLPERSWFDIERVIVVERVMDAPTFAAYTLPKTQATTKGAECKPSCGQPLP